jgi:tyrosine-protein kinase Etk/Wzc
METRPGQRFEIGRQQVLDTIEDLRTALTVGEKVKESDILALSLQNTSPERGAEVLNAILDQYILENIEQRTREATRTLAILQDELADHRDKEMRAEGSLVMSKSSARSADPSEESRLILQRTSDVERDILAARQKRDELLRTYKASADVVRIVDEQIAKLQEERGRLQARAQALPQAQQEASRLSKEVQVSQDRYGALTSLQAMAIQQLQLAKAGEISSVRIVDRAWPTLRPIKPRKSLIAALGLILGTVAGMTAVLVAYTMKNKGVQDPQVLESTFGMPVLATIPHSKAQSDLTRRLEKQEDAHALLAVTHPTDLAVESLRSLRTSLHYALVDAPNRSILLAGPSPDIGKSFVCLNFATILAQYGAKVLLVDADMRKGRLHKYFGIENRLKGLSEVLVGSLRWQDAVHSLHGVDLLSTGTLPPNPSKLLVGERFTAFMKEACEAYDYVLFDAPPVLAVTDAAILGAHVGATLLLLKDSQHPLGEIRTALQSLDIAGAKVKGFVFNDIDSEGARAGYRRYTYHYTYEA